MRRRAMLEPDVYAMSNAAQPTDILAQLYDDVVALRLAVIAESAAIRGAWPHPADERGFAASAANLSHYLSLRRRDLRPLQQRLMAVGLSSLGRLENRVLPGLEAVEATLAALVGRKPMPYPPEDAFFSGAKLLAERTEEVLGPISQRGTGLL